MTAENLYLSTEQYLSALKKLRDKIANGEELVDVDDDFPGNKDSWCSWGLCTNNPEVFPDPQSHLWPEEFIEQQRFAPKYRGPNQWCPLDSRIRDGKPHGEAESPGSGCFYRCMVFSPKKYHGPKDRASVLKLYDNQIAEVDAKASALLAGEDK